MLFRSLLLPLRCFLLRSQYKLLWKNSAKSFRTFSAMHFYWISHDSYHCWNLKMKIVSNDLIQISFRKWGNGKKPMSTGHWPGSRVFYRHSYYPSIILVHRVRQALERIKIWCLKQQKSITTRRYTVFFFELDTCQSSDCRG